MIVIRWLFFFVGVMIFSLGITMAIQVQHLGLHPWDVLNVALYEKLGLSIGSWAIIISFVLVIISWILDKRYIKLGTFFNAVMVGAFVDFYMWLDFLPSTTNIWQDILMMLGGMVIMGFGGGVYNAPEVGAGPRDGFMLSISDKTKFSIGQVRMMTESSVLVLGFLLGGPVFIATFVFTFIQSPIFQFCFLRFRKLIQLMEVNYDKKREIA